MASAWVDIRKVKVGDEKVKRLGSRTASLSLGGRESKVRHAGSFRALREPNLRRDFIAGESPPGASPS